MSSEGLPVTGWNDFGRYDLQVVDEVELIWIR